VTFTAPITLPGLALDPHWYRRAVFYEVMVRSFVDSNGDGSGDLGGLIAKLDYLQWLGVDALWIPPIYSSPLRDGGYDVADYKTILPDFGTVDEFRDLITKAHERNMRIIGPDLPGFGASTPMTEAPHSIEGYARWFGAFIESLGLSTPPVVLGHSFGSMVSTRAIAAGMPARALILVNPIATDPKVGAGVAMTRLTRAFYGVSRGLPKPVANALLRNWLVVQFMSMSLVTTDDPKLRQWIHEEHHRFFNGYSDPRTVADAFDASLEAEVGKSAGGVNVPTLMVAGEKDTITPLDGQYTTVEIFPDARLVVIPKVGHLIHYETPDAAAAAITEFLDELP
jgi:pimeloyl-ACP methyl ester carboxylesterase